MSDGRRPLPFLAGGSMTTGFDTMRGNLEMSSQLRVEPVAVVGFRVAFDILFSALTSSACRRIEACPRIVQCVLRSAVAGMFLTTKHAT